MKRSISEITIDIKSIKEEIKKKEKERFERYGDLANSYYLIRKEVIDKKLKEIEGKIWEEVK